MTIETPFELERRKIIINGFVGNADQRESIRLIVDTGAGTSIISKNVALFLGFNLDKIKKSEQFISASGRFNAKIIHLEHFSALGLHIPFQTAVFDLPPQTLVSGLLGVDFLLQFSRFSIDFNRKIISTTI